MTHPDSPEDILEKWLEEARYFGEIQGAFMGGILVNGREPYNIEEIKVELLAQLEEYYTNKFLEVLPSSATPKDYVFPIRFDNFQERRMYGMGVGLGRLTYRQDVEAAIKQLSKRGKDNE